MGLKPLRWRLIHCVARISRRGTFQIARPSLAKQNGEPAANLHSDNEGSPGNIAEISHSGIIFKLVGPGLGDL